MLRKIMPDIMYLTENVFGYFKVILDSSEPGAREYRLYIIGVLFLAAFLQSRSTLQNA